MPRVGLEKTEDKKQQVLEELKQKFLYGTRRHETVRQVNYWLREHPLVDPSTVLVEFVGDMLIASFELAQ